MIGDKNKVGGRLTQLLNSRNVSVSNQARHERAAHNDRKVQCKLTIKRNNKTFSVRSQTALSTQMKSTCYEHIMHISVKKYLYSH